MRTLNTIIRKINNNHLISIILLCILTSSSILAGTNTTKIIDPMKTKGPPPDLLFLQCPANSACSKALGKLRLEWINTLKSKSKKKINNFFKKNGALIKVWQVEEESKNSPDIFSWESPCDFHNLKDKKKISIAKTFTKKLSLDSLPGKTLLSPAYLLTRKSKSHSIVKYLIPRSEIPIQLSGKNLIFLLEEAGQYFYIKVSPSGALEMISPKSIPILSVKEESSEVECPKDLESAFKKDYKTSPLFAGYYCKKIWNNKLRTKQTLIFGWACE